MAKAVKRDPLEVLMPSVDITEKQSNNAAEHVKITEKQSNKKVVERKGKEKAVRYTISMYPSVIERIKDYCQKNITMNQSRLIQEAVLRYLDQLEKEGRA